MDDLIHKVCISFSADILHVSHLNILKIAKQKGYVIVGLLADKAISSYKAPIVAVQPARKEVFYEWDFETLIEKQKLLLKTWVLKSEYR